MYAREGKAREGTKKASPLRGGRYWLCMKTMREVTQGAA